MLSGVVVSSATILKTSIAAFSANTTNGTNNWSAGTLNLDTGAASAMFVSGTDGPLVGGQVIQKCIRVHYTGSWTGANVKLFGAAGAQTALSPYLTIGVEVGSATDTTAGTCANFTGGSAMGTSKKLDTFIADHSSYTNGVTAWSTGATDEWKAFRFTITADSDDAAQGKTAEATFTWEVQK